MSNIRLILAFIIIGHEISYVSMHIYMKCNFIVTYAGAYLIVSEKLGCVDQSLTMENIIELATTFPISLGL